MSAGLLDLAKGVEPFISDEFDPAVDSRKTGKSFDVVSTFVGGGTFGEPLSCSVSSLGSGGARASLDFSTTLGERGESFNKGFTVDPEAVGALSCLLTPPVPKGIGASFSFASIIGGDFTPAVSVELEAGDGFVCALVSLEPVTKDSCSDAGAALQADRPIEESGVGGVALSACVTAGLVFAVGLVIG